MSSYLIEYMKAHLISLEQDLENIASEMDLLDPESKDFKELDFEYNWTQGQAIATRHFIQVGEEHATNNN
jgi:hypothetical protein